jgi:hypothetical protein
MRISRPVESFLDSYGYVAVFLGTILEGETVLVLAGLLAHQGYLTLLTVLVVAATGSLTSDLLYFWLGREYGIRTTRRFSAIERKLVRARRFAARNQNVLILSMRFMYGFRIIMPMALGCTSSNKVDRLRLDVKSQSGAPTIVLPGSVCLADPYALRVCGFCIWHRHSAQCTYTFPSMKIQFSSAVKTISLLNPTGRRCSSSLP